MTVACDTCSIIQPNESRRRMCQIHQNQNNPTSSPSKQRLLGRPNVQIIWSTTFHCTRWWCYPCFYHFTISTQCACCSHIAADEFIDLQPLFLSPGSVCYDLLPFLHFLTRKRPIKIRCGSFQSKRWLTETAVISFQILFFALFREYTAPWRMSD